MKTHIKKTMLVPHLAIAFIVLSLFLQPLGELIEGFLLIQINESILLTDYVAISGIGSALLNSGLLMLISYLVIYKLGSRVTGSIFAGILTIGGFAFFGKNIINVLIIFVGVYLYAKYKKINMKSVIVVFLFSTGLSPISSLIMFGLGLSLYISIPLGILVGLLAGFLLVEISTRVISFHQGYDLYNVGFASGILSFGFFSLIKLSGLSYQTNLIYSNDSHDLLFYMFIVICLLFIGVGLVLNDFNIKPYKDLLKLSGRAATDFTRRDNQPITMINIGVTGLAALVVLMLLGVHINGPVFGGLFTIIGFSAFGKHIRNVLPPMVGVLIISVIFDIEISIIIVLAILFSTGLAPVAGEFGIFVGILTGMLHLPIALSLGTLHGGVLLYSNGFAAAFTALIITSVISTFKRSER
jgi:hypothetical protein